MDYKSDPNNIGKWEKFFRWVNGEDSLDSVWEKEMKIKIITKRKEHQKSIEGIIDKIISYKKKAYVVFSVLITVLYIGILLYTASLLPEHGNINNPTNNEVSQRYIERGVEETGALNIVSGMILDYRAFDTFGETVVLFTAVMSVAILLKRDKNNICKREDNEMSAEEEIMEKFGSSIPKYIARFVTPISILYGSYVILNGHISPGGGFSGGAIVGAGLILYAASYGPKKAAKVLNYKQITNISIICLLIYFFSKGYSFFMGGNHLHDHIPKGIPGHILSGGFILPLNICVGIIVACTMYSFYSYFTKGDI